MNYSITLAIYRHVRMLKLRNFWSYHKQKGKRICARIEEYGWYSSSDYGENDTNSIKSITRVDLWSG